MLHTASRIGVGCLTARRGGPRPQAGSTMHLQPKHGQGKRRGQVMIVDPHTLTRNSVAAWISRSSDLEVCSAAGRTSEALRAMKRKRPDVVISEIMCPDDLGFIRELHHRYPRVPIVVFSTQDAAVFAARARAAGAAGYLMKEAGGDRLVQSIRAVLRIRPMRNGRTIPRQPGRRPAGCSSGEGKRKR